MKYKHKIDIWVGVLLYGSVLMFVPLFFVVSEDELLIMILSFVGMAIIILPFMYGYMEFKDDHLLIRMHVFRQKIYYDKIKSIRLCRNWLSSMAMTANRIEIKEYGKSFVRGTTYIGPVDREAVFEELKYYCRNLEENRSE